MAALREAIVAGQFEPGERLIEERLSRRFETSRGPVREALRQLEQEGLVLSTPYRGAVVLGVSEEEVQEVLIPIRLTLERFSFPKALALMTDDDFAELAAVVWQMGEAARTGDLPRIVEADLRFHETVLAKSGLAHTVQVWRTVAPRIRAYFLRYGRYRHLDSIVEEHRELLTAMQTRDPGVLLPLLEQHIVVKAPARAADGRRPRRAARGRA